ncbi:MAG: energy transducer TonB, partial [Desulfobacterota bacterium]|nr:energy transducer TonB [Thermodesulfobacteriota bacterium]
ASNRQLEGMVIIRFSITSEGIAQGIDIIKSSGYEILDRAGMKAVHNASPFPPPPNGFTSIPIEVPIIFKLIN